VSAPRRLRAEHLAEALGIWTPTPRLSWELPTGTVAQQAYELELDRVAQGRVESTRSLLVPWPDAPLASRQRVECRVRTWTESGESEWSAPLFVEAGLIEPTDWVARWIQPHEDEIPAPRERPAYLLRRTFELDRPDAARLYATAHGLYEAFLNGHRVGDQELTPGVGSYEHHLDVQTFDVTELVQPGINTWDVVLSDGWYRGANGFTQATDCYGERTAFLGQLHVGDAVVATDAEWHSSTGPIVAADLMVGESVDLRIEPGEGEPVDVVSHDMTRLTASPASPSRRVQELRPVSVRRLDAERQVVDLGQNINGWTRLADLGPAGTTVTLTHGETIDEQGDVTQEHLDGFDPFTGQVVPVGMTDHVTSAGLPGQDFEPRHTTHGFRYVRVTGHPGRLTPDDVTGVVVHTDLRRTGWFRCSDERLNRLHDVADWSFRGNACEIPTDCPTRERSGWTGDYQIFLPTAAFLYDVAGFTRKWLRSLVAEARADGCVRNIAPDPLAANGRRSFLEQMGMEGSAGWGDAITIVPWELYRTYADEQVLEECWPAMLAWLDFAAEAARSHRHPSREARPGPAAAQEEFVWDGTFHFGEWLEPGASMADLGTQDNGAVATAYFHRSALLAARVGRMLGHDVEADRLDALAAATRDAWQREFIADDGTLSPATQATHVRALAFGLVPDELRDATAARLAQLVVDADRHLGTGFLATPSLLPMLADHGHGDLAYDLLLQDSPPSWMYMVERGATTVWESWEGIAEGLPSSLNHYSKGAVISFLHTHTAGIRQLDDESAYRRFRIAPRPGGDLTWAEATHDSAYGRIESSWRITRDEFELDVTVPPGTSAEVVLPDDTHHRAGPGTAHYRTAAPDKEHHA
jgi:alpha-L-rhamnosidase